MCNSGLYSFIWTWMISIMLLFYDGQSYMFKKKGKISPIARHTPYLLPFHHKFDKSEYDFTILKKKSVDRGGYMFPICKKII